MQKYFLSFLFLGLSLFFSSTASAQVKNITTLVKNNRDIYVAGYVDYPPFGFIEKIQVSKNAAPHYIYRSVFEDVVADLQGNTRFKFIYAFDAAGYDRSLDNDFYFAGINSGKYDMFLGAYYDTQKYNRIQVTYPAIMNNPVTIVTMPDTAKKIKNLSQLKKMKGAVCTKEYFTDFVTNDMKNYNLEYIDDTRTMFEKLYTGEVDYLFMTQYFGIIEAIKLGIRNQLSFSKQIVWNIPMFIGVAKISPSRKFLIEKISSYSERPEFQKKIKDKLHQIIQDYEKKYHGVIPPTFIKKENNESTQEKIDNTTSSLDLLSQEGKIQ